MTIEKKLLGTNPVATGDTPEAVSFDGTNDYLSRSSDMTGNVDGKTFTFSCWIYQPRNSAGTLPSPRPLSNGSGRFKVYGSSGSGVGSYTLRGKNTSGTIVLNATTAAKVSGDGWVHLLVSIDMASTVNRKVYINGEVSSVTWTTYTNDNIDFTDTVWRVNSTGGQKARISNVFLDYTYRDLSIEANRRLFIDADGKPADGQADLSPILYLPMTSADTAGTNSGTGGDFTVNGVLATAERGPNQDNCSASVFDGVGDYLRLTGNAGASDTKQMVVSIAITGRPDGVNDYAVSFDDVATYPVFYVSVRSTGILYVNASVSGSAKWYMQSPDGYIPAGKNIHVTASVDLSTGFNHLYLNGKDILSDMQTVMTVDETIQFTTVDTIDVGRNGSNYSNISIGELYFDDAYIDLATDNPFWDSDANRPNSVRKVIADTGVTPLIALPMIGSDAGNNLGSGGDFTVNSGPYTGARGGSEYWARSASFNGTTQYLRRSSITGLSDTTDVTAVVSFTVDNASREGGIFSVGEEIGNSSIGFNIRQSTSVIDLQVGFGAASIATVAENVLATGSWFTVMYGTRSGKTSIYLYKDGALLSSRTNTNTYSAIDITTNKNYIGRFQDEFEHDGQIGCVWFDTTYIDFTQEANRNKFIDQLGYRANLGADGSNPTGNQPLIYLNNDIHLGTNLGSGGNYTPYNSPTVGSDVTPA